MDLLIYPPKKRAVTSLFSDGEFVIPSLILGEAVPFRVAQVEKLQGDTSRFWEPVSISNNVVRIGIGKTFQDPVAGTWSVEYGASNSNEMAYNVSTSNLETELNTLASIISAGGVTVSGSPGFYIVTFNDPGARTDFVIDVSNLAPLSIGDVEVLLPGNGDVAEVQIIRLLQNCAALVTLGPDTPAADLAIDNIELGGSGVNCKFRITLSGNPFEGSFTITLTGNESPFIAWNASAEDVRAAIAAIPTIDSIDNVQVVKEADNSWLVGMMGDYAGVLVGPATGDGSALKGLIYRPGTLDTGTAAMGLLFGEASSVELIFEVESTPPGGSPQKIYRQSLTLLAPAIFDDFIDSFGLDIWKIFSMDIPDGAESMVVTFDTPFANAPSSVLVTVGVATGHIPFSVTLIEDSIADDGFTVVFGSPAATGDRIHVIAYA